MAYHMFFGFNLAPGTTVDTAEEALRVFSDRMIAANRLVSTTPIARRHRHPVLDTAQFINLDYFVTMTFRDRMQANASVKQIYGRSEPTDSLHNTVIGLLTDAVFLCVESPH